MKNLNLVLFLATALAFTACGPTDKDPLEDRKDLNLSETESPKPLGFQSTMTQLFQIDVADHLTFVQGEARAVDFSARTAFSNPAEVHFRLVMVEGPTDLGLSFSPASGRWVLAWTPNNRVLSAAENFKTFPIKIKFELLPSSSARVKKQFAGQTSERAFNLILMKDASQPIIEDSVKISQAQPLKKGQNVSIDFVVASKGITENQDLDVNMYSGPDAPSRELTQFDALFGITQKARRIESLGKDKEGRSRFKYRINFNVDRYNQALVAAINENAVLKSRLAKGEINKSEAAITIEAMNRYNGARSAERIIVLEAEVSP